MISIAKKTPSGYAGLIERMITVNTPIRNPYIHLPVLVWEEVTGSVAIKTVPNRKLPNKICCKGVMVNIAFGVPPDSKIPSTVNILNKLKRTAVKTKPITQETIILQDAIPQ